MERAKSDRTTPGGRAVVEVDLTGTGSVALPKEFVDWVEAVGLEEQFAAYWEKHPWRKTHGGVIADFAIIEAAPRVVFEAIAEFIRTADQLHVRSRQPSA